MNSSEISFRDASSSQKISHATKATKQPQVLELSQMSSYKSNLKEGLSKQDIQQPLFEAQENDLSIESRSDTESNSCCAKLRRWLLSPEHNATFKCICFSVYFITILVLLTLSLLYYYLDGGLSISAFGGSLDYLSQNLVAVPIQGIAILPINSACPTGYDAVTLGEFAGNVNGCYCPGDNVLMQGSCSRKTNCTYYDGINSQQINYWRGHMFCIKKANNLVTAVSCDVDYTECYPGGCIPANETCPLTQQTLMSTLASNPLTDSTLNIQIVQDTTSSDMPIVFLEISLSGLPCFDSNALPENDNTYPLSASDAEGCGDYGEDSTAFEIDSQSELDLYSQNSFSALITALPLYQTYFQQQVFLVGRNKIEINATSTCLGMDTTLISDFANTLNLLNTRTLVSLAYGAYLHIIVFVSCLLVYFFKKSGLSFRKQIFQDDRFQFLYLVFVLLEFALYFQLFIYITGVTISLTSQVNQINTYTTSQCFIKDQVNTILLDFGDSIEGTVNAVYGFSGLLFFAQGGSLVLLAIGLIGGKLHAVKKKRKNTD